MSNCDACARCVPISGFSEFHPYRMRFTRAGEGAEFHNHRYAHVWIGLAGQFRIETRDDDGAIRDLAIDAAWPLVEIPAGTWHRITPLVDDARSVCLFGATGERRLDPKADGFLQASPFVFHGDV
jgi:hypothetical protein